MCHTDTQGEKVGSILPNWKHGEMELFISGVLGDRLQKSMLNCGVFKMKMR